MAVALIFIAIFVWLCGLLAKSEVKQRDRFVFVNKFIALYEKQTGIRLTYDQAVALVQVTVATMRKSRADKVYLDQGYPLAQKMADDLCEEAERKVRDRNVN